jgi:hypothetical protein
MIILYFIYKYYDLISFPSFIVQKEVIKGPSIIYPLPGQIVSNLRPTIELEDIYKAEAYSIQISPEPSFNSINVITYLSNPTDKITKRFGSDNEPFAALAEKYQRSNDYDVEKRNQWRIPYNLTVMINSPYGYRIAPCRDWLKALTDRIIEGHDDPIQALHNFVAFTIVNQGSAGDYFNAYHMLDRDRGVCGNTAELTASLAAAAGFKARLLSLQGTTGHVTAEIQRPSGDWVFSDALYNIWEEKPISQILDEVSSDEEAFNFEPFIGSHYRYRDFLHKSNFAYRLETSKHGILFTQEVIEDEGTTFQDLKFSCDTDMNTLVETVKNKKISNVFFIRAAFLKDEQWSEFSKSYFIFRPEPVVGVEVIDNAKDIWRNEDLVPAEFKDAQEIPP